MARVETYVTLEWDKDNPDLEVIFRQLPMQFARVPMQSTFRTAVRPFLTEAKSNFPTKMQPWSSTLGVKNNKSASIMAGVRLKKTYVVLRDGRKWDAFYPLYWKNYGTLDNRDKNHKFDKARSRKTANWRGGISAEGFMEKAWENTKDKVAELIEKNLTKRVVAFIERKSK